MRSFKKALLAVALVLLIVIVFSIGAIVVAIKAPSSLISEKKALQKFAGSIDLVTVGASQCYYSFQPIIIDEELNCFSYNLAQNSIRNDQRALLLKNELSRNDIKTVIIEISHDVLLRSGKLKDADAAAKYLLKLDSADQIVETLSKQIPPSSYVYIYSEVMQNAMKSLMSFIKKPRSSGSPSLKGAVSFKPTDWSLDSESAKELLDSNQIFSKDRVSQSSIDGLMDIIELCKENDIRTIVAVVPVSDKFIWTNRNLDEFRTWLNDFCTENELELYDFNLIKARYSLFSDENSFSVDDTHLSGIGAEAFTKYFCDMLKRVDAGCDISSEFYNTYEQMKADSPYWKFID